jgi:hypothetical protein
MVRSELNYGISGNGRYLLCPLDYEFSRARQNECGISSLIATHNDERKSWVESEAYVSTGSEAQTLVS